MHNIEISHKNKSLSLFHINTCSLNKNFDDLQHLLSCTKTKFDIIAISETRITKQVSLSNNLNLNNYSFEFTPTETSAGVTLLYIANHGKRLYPVERVKYLGVKIDTNFSWQYHVNDLSIKLNAANALLFKMRKYVSLKIIRSIYFAIFDSYVSYCCPVWGQNRGSIQQIVILQKKAVRIIDFQPKNS